MFYLQQGIKVDCIEPSNKPSFYVMQISDNNYAYSNDSIFYDAFNASLDIRTVLIESYFTDYDNYIESINNVPLILMDSGLYSNSEISNSDLEKFINDIKHNHPELASQYNKIMYFCDVDFIFQSIQNLIIGMNQDFINYYKIITDIYFRDDLKDGIYETTSQNTSLLASTLGGYFIKIGSIMDLLTKYIYEIENKQEIFDSYIKLASRSLLYGNRNVLKLNNNPRTIFYRDNLLGEIKSIRNEIVHNGCWEHTPRVYSKIVNGDITERFMLFPDMQNGNYCRYVNRYHFFSNGKKVNDILPQIHEYFLKKLKDTFIEICKSVYNKD